MFLTLPFILAGCANPLNQATYERYCSLGDTAFANKNFQYAGVMYSRAAQNADMGKLGDGPKARALYNAGESVRLWGGDYKSAESMLLQAQAISEKIWNDSAHDRERNSLLVALSLLYLDTNEPAKGWIYVSKTFGQPDLPNFKWKIIYEKYEPVLTGHGMTVEAGKLREELEKRQGTAQSG